MIKIQIINSPDQETDSIYIFHKNEIQIGRSKNCDLIIHDPSIEHKHLQLAFIENILIAKPIKSTFNYYLNSKKCFGARRVNVGDSLAAGQSVFKVLESSKADDIGYKKLAEERLQTLVDKKSDLVELLELLQNEILITEGNADA
jgi:hypothetical protein